MQVYIDTSPAAHCRRSRHRRSRRLTPRGLLTLFADRFTIYFILFLSFLLLSVSNSGLAVNTRSFSFVLFLALEVPCFLVFCLAFDRHRGRRTVESDEEDNVSINNNITVARLHPTTEEDPSIAAAVRLLRATTAQQHRQSSSSSSRLVSAFPMAELAHSIAEGSVLLCERWTDAGSVEAPYGVADYIHPPLQVNQEELR